MSRVPLGKSIGANSAKRRKILGEAEMPEKGYAAPVSAGAKKARRGRPKKTGKLALISVGLSTTQETIDWINELSTRAVRVFIEKPDGFKLAKAVTRVSIVRAALKHLLELDDEALARLVEDAGH